MIFRFEFNDTKVAEVFLTDDQMETLFFGGKYTPDRSIDFYATETERYWSVMLFNVNLRI